MWLPPPYWSRYEQPRDTTCVSDISRLRMPYREPTGEAATMTRGQIESLRLAVGSLLDIVSELVLALELGHRPDASFVEVTVDAIQKHKKDLDFYE
jgi:hypothetical protein